MVFSIIFGLILTMLVLSQCYMVSIGFTTYEFLKKFYAQIGNPFHEGCRENWRLLCFRDAA